MGEHFKPGNVVRGNFRRRQSNKGGGTAWLSPEAYRALSREDKMALAVRRQLRGHERRHGPTPARLRKGYYARQRWTWFAIVCAIGAVSGWSFGPWPTGPAVVAPTADIRWGEAQTVPQAVADPGDAAWAARATGQDWAPDRGSGSRAPAERIAFTFCHNGGGTNCVVDGDTFYLNGDKIRIADIDAPETHDYDCASELERGQRATRRLQDLLSSGSIRLASTGRDTDSYGRKLRTVEVNGAGVGEALVGAGLARWYAGGRRSWC